MRTSRLGKSRIIRRITEQCWNLFSHFSFKKNLWWKISAVFLVAHKYTKHRGLNGWGSSQLITRYHWSDHQVEPGSELRTFWGCGHQPGTLRKNTHTQRQFNRAVIPVWCVALVVLQLSQPERLKDDSWRSLTPWWARFAPLLAASPSTGPKPSSFFIVVATLATSPEYGSLSTPLYAWAWKTKRLIIRWYMLFVSMDVWVCCQQIKVETNLFPLHHLLVEVVRERALGVELSRSFGAHEDAVLTHQTSSADGDQRDAVAAHPLVQVEVPALHLSADRDGPAAAERLFTGWGTSLCVSEEYTVTTFTWLHLDPRPPHRHQLQEWCDLYVGTGCRSLLR